MISLKTIKEQYIDSVLEQTDFNFNIFVNAGEYKTATRNQNTVKEYINGVFLLTQPETQVLSSNLKAYALETTLSFALPLKNYTDTDNEFILPKEVSKTGNTYSVAQFYEAISRAFEQAGSILNLTENNTNYIGGIGYQLPVPQSLQQRQFLGQTIDFRMSIAFALLPNGMSSQNVELSITYDGVTEKFTATDFEIAKTPALNSDIVASNDGNATNYSESTALSISCNVPLIQGSLMLDRIMAYCNGLANNEPMTVNIAYKVGEMSYLDFCTEVMIFGGVRVRGGGVSNLTAQISFVPYTELDG